MDRTMQAMERMVRSAAAPLDSGDLKGALIDQGHLDQDIRASFWHLLDAERIQWLDDRRVASPEWKEGARGSTAQ